MEYFESSHWRMPRVVMPLALGCFAFIGMVLSFVGMVMLLVKTGQVSDTTLYSAVDHKVLFVFIAIISLVTWIACIATIGTTASRKLLTAQIIQIFLLLGGLVFFIFSTVVLARERSRWDSMFGVCKVLESSEKRSYCHEIYTAFTLLLISSIFGLILHFVLAVWTVAVAIKLRMVADYEKSYEEVTVIRSHA